MITGLIFFMHLFFSALVFTKKWQDENLSAGFLNVALIGILFTVGWTVFGQIVKVFMEQPGFGPFLDRDAFALLLLTVAEYFFYRMYYPELFVTRAGREKQ